MIAEGLIYQHRILIHNNVDQSDVEEEMRQEHMKGYLVPGAVKIEIVDWEEEDRIYTESTQCAVVTIVKYRVTKSADTDSPSAKAIEFAVRNGGTDEMHHLRWVVDQMVRALAGDKYDEIVTATKTGDDGPNTYEWHVGIAP